MWDPFSDAQAPKAPVQPSHAVNRDLTLLDMDLLPPAPPPATTEQTASRPPNGLPSRPPPAPPAPADDWDPFGLNQSITAPVKLSSPFPDPDPFNMQPLAAAASSNSSMMQPPKQSKDGPMSAGARSACIAAPSELDAALRNEQLKQLGADLRRMSREGIPVAVTGREAAPPAPQQVSNGNPFAIEDPLWGYDAAMQATSTGTSTSSAQQPQQQQQFHTNPPSRPPSSFTLTPNNASTTSLIDFASPSSSPTRAQSPAMPPLPKSHSSKQLQQPQQRRVTFDLPEPSPAPSSASNASSAAAQERSETNPSTICADLRFAPLAPKGSHQPRVMAAGLGHLFAGPCTDGVAFLQYASAEAAPAKPASVAHVMAGSKEDWDAAPCAEVPLPAEVHAKVTCMIVDEQASCMWTGHQDGSVCCWLLAPDKTALFHHHWSAHTLGEVTSLLRTQYGQIWTGSAVGSLKVWTYDLPVASGRAPKKVLECKNASLGRPHRKTRHLLLSPNGRIVWSVGTNNVCFWDAYTFQYLGTHDREATSSGASAELYREGGDEARFRVSPKVGLSDRVVDRTFISQIIEPEEEEQNSAAMTMAMKGIGKAARLAGKLGKRLMSNLDKPAPGAEAAVDNSGTSIKAVAADSSDSVYLGYKSGLLERYTQLGKLVYQQVFKAGICSLACVGQQLWVATMDGRVRVLEFTDAKDKDSGKIQVYADEPRSWQGHVCPLRSMCQVGALVYSLGRDGSIKGWSAAAPTDQHLDTWREQVRGTLQPQKLRVLCGTWNVNERRPNVSSLTTWLGERAGGAHVVCVALQEMEMGTGSVVKDGLYSYMAKSKLEQGNQNAQWWVDCLLRVLGPNRFAKVGLRQMSGVLVIVFCRNDLMQPGRPNVGEVATASVGCGVMGVGGNKGGVAVSFSLFRRRVIVVSSHFAAHQENVEARNADYAKIVRNMHFSNTSAAAKQQGDDLEVEASAGSSGSPGAGDDGGSQFGSGSASADDLQWGAGLRDAEMLLWMGDFNYRIDGVTYEDAVAAIKHRAFDELLRRDQLRSQVAEGRVFQGLLEGPVTFPPTYKFEKELDLSQYHTPEQLLAALHEMYDQSEKRRIPAWTDRIFFRGSAPSRSALEPPQVVGDEDLAVYMDSKEAYNACMQVTDSDHKPVYAELTVRLPACQQDAKRQRTLHLIRSIAAVAGGQSPALQIEKRLITVPEGQEQRLVLSNSSDTPLHFTICGTDAEPSASPLLAAALPGWLEVVPLRGAVPAKAHLVVKVRGSSIYLQKQLNGLIGNLRRGQPVRSTLAVVAHSGVTADSGWGAKSVQSPATLFQVVLCPRGNQG